MVIIYTQEVHHIRKELFIQNYLANCKSVIASCKALFCFSAEICIMFCFFK